MTRSEMYVYVQENGLQQAFENKYGKNFTRAKNTELETFIAEHSKSTVNSNIDSGVVSCDGKKTQEVILKDTEKLKNFNATKAIIKMVTVLQSEDVITAEEAQEVLDELNAE